MSVRDDILSNKSKGDIASYGWQEELGDSVVEFGYISSFKSAADILAEAKAPDYFLFPLVFCYRQYLELLFKNIYRINHTVEEYQNYIKRVSHDLARSFENIEPYLVNEISSEEVSYVEEVVSIFHELDIGSYNFRYSTDKNMNKSLPQDLHINIMKLKEGIDTIDSYLHHTYNSD